MNRAERRRAKKKKKGHNPKAIEDPLKGHKQTFKIGGKRHILPRKWRE